MIKKLLFIFILVVLAFAVGYSVYYFNSKMEITKDGSTLDGQPTIDNFQGPSTPPGKESNPLNINFTKEGNIVKNVPGMEENVWYLLYEKPGAPAQREKLIFIPESKCTYNAVTKSCYETQIGQGDRIFVSGEKIDIGVKISTIIIKEKSVQ